jgi:hypothetical protein
VGGNLVLSVANTSGEANCSDDIFAGSTPIFHRGNTKLVSGRNKHPHIPRNQIRWRRAGDAFRKNSEISSTTIKGKTDLTASPNKVEL